MKIISIGDSTMQPNPAGTWPQTGWIQELPRFLAHDVHIRNFARNARSSKSFIAEGRFAEALSFAEAGDFLFVQFGHNDEKAADPERYTDPDGAYKDNLRFFAEEARKRQCLPVFFTPISRRLFLCEQSASGNGTVNDTSSSKDGMNFGSETICGTILNSHAPYQRAMIECAEELNVPCVDMTQRSAEVIAAFGPEKSRLLFMNFDADMYENFPESRNDNTHLRPMGAHYMSRCAAEGLKELAQSGKFPEYQPLFAALR